MPYTFSRRKGKYCMTSQDTGKTYCYGSLTARKKGQRMHEAFKHGWKPTGKAANNAIKKAAFKKK